VRALLIHCESETARRIGDWGWAAGVNGSIQVSGPHRVRLVRPSCDHIEDVGNVRTSTMPATLLCMDALCNACSA